MGISIIQDWELLYWILIIPLTWSRYSLRELLIGGSMLNILISCILSGYDYYLQTNKRSWSSIDLDIHCTWVSTLDLFFIFSIEEVYLIFPKATSQVATSLMFNFPSGNFPKVRLGGAAGCIGAERFGYRIS